MPPRPDGRRRMTCRRAPPPMMTAIPPASSQEGAERLPHDQRGRGRTSHPPARAPLLGNQVPPGEAAEARRRTPLLPARRISLLRRISDLLYIQGYTIKGVQRLLREGGGRLSDDIPPATPRTSRGRGRAPQRRSRPRAADDPDLPMPASARARRDPRLSACAAALVHTLAETARRLRALLPKPPGSRSNAPARPALNAAAAGPAALAVRWPAAAPLGVQAPPRSERSAVW